MHIVKKDFQSFPFHPGHVYICCHRMSLCDPQSSSGYPSLGTLLLVSLNPPLAH